MALTTVLHFEDHLIDCDTLAEALREAADIVEGLNARGIDTDTLTVSGSYIGDKGSATVRFRVETRDEVNAALG